MNESTLDRLLEQWAATQRLTEADLARIRATVMSHHHSEANDIDSDRMWDLLRPVTRLLRGPHSLHDTLMRGYA
jgi:hypothetical protein